MDRPLRLITANPVDQLARTIEALLVVASRRSPSTSSREAADDDAERIELALGLLSDRYREGRSGIVLEHVAGGYAFRASREAAERLRAAVRAAGRARPLAGGARDARDRRLPRPVQPARDRAHPRRRRRLGGRRPARARADRRSRARGRAGRRRPLPDDAALRARLRARERSRRCRGSTTSARPPRTIRERLHSVAVGRSTRVLTYDSDLPGAAAQHRHAVAVAGDPVDVELVASRS